MRVVQIRLKNFRAFADLKMEDIPNFCVLIGANGTGKSTLFSVFTFLRDAMDGNVTSALARLGGSRGFEEVRTRGETGPIEIELKIRANIGRDKPTLITYSIAIDLEGGRPVVAHERLEYRRGSKGRPWRFIDFAYGKGKAVINELDAAVTDETQLQREEQTLKSADILAIKGLAQFEKFPAAVRLGDLIERWHVSDLHIADARGTPTTAHVEHLSTHGENLPLVIDYLYRQHPLVFKKILTSLARRIPGVTNVEPKVTEEGRVLLKFRDGSFEEPFLSRYVSDGTIKMLAYLVLLNDPNPYPLLGVEEPENQLYPSLLNELAEEFRSYATRGGQVFVSTHSPDFLNAIETSEAFWFAKVDGCTTVHRVRDDEQLVAFMNDGDQLGYLWKQGLFEGADPT